MTVLAPSIAVFTSLCCGMARTTNKTLKEVLRRPRRHERDLHVLLLQREAVAFPVPHHLRLRGLLQEEIR